MGYSSSFHFLSLYSTLFSTNTSARFKQGSLSKQSSNILKYNIFSWQYELLFKISWQDISHTCLCNFHIHSYPACLRLPVQRKIIRRNYFLKSSLLHNSIYFSRQKVILFCKQKTEAPNAAHLKRELKSSQTYTRKKWKRKLLQQ
jgi:hypothetical protein